MLTWACWPRRALGLPKRVCSAEATPAATTGMFFGCPEERGRAEAQEGWRRCLSF